ARALSGRDGEDPRDVAHPAALHARRAREHPRPHPRVRGRPRSDPPGAHRRTRPRDSWGRELDRAGRLAQRDDRAVRPRQSARAGVSRERAATVGLAVAQGTRPARTPESLAASMLPPEIPHTTGPGRGRTAGPLADPA